MVEDEDVAAFLSKALESLETAESEYVNRRYNSCANRCYYACFQAAIAALIRAGIGPRQASGQWRHEFVQAAFAGHLINRRKLYSASLGEALSHNRVLRQAADYAPESVTQKQADRALRRAQLFVLAVHQQEKGRR